MTTTLKHQLFEMAPTDDALVQSIMAACHVSRNVATVLSNRSFTDINDIQQFLHVTLNDLHDPMLMANMADAVALIKQHIANHDKIVIYGDYDVDGLTATSVLLLTLRYLGADVRYYLPNRKVGYGPHLDIYQQLVTAGYRLLITVDNGITGHRAINYAREHGMDVIVTDHHELPATLPNANAIIHPQLGNYPFADLAGVGVAFKLSTALIGQTPTNWLGLAALGTIADAVSITGENRAIVKYGLQRLAVDPTAGMHQLVSAVKDSNDDAPLTTTDIGFGIAPLLNTINRMGLTTSLGVHLLTTRNQQVAEQLTKQLQVANTTRKQRQADLIASLSEDADAQLQAGHRSLVLAKQFDIDVSGMLGLVAGAMVQKYHVPTIVLAQHGDMASGSGRSANGINIYQALVPLQQSFKSFGGHAYALGINTAVNTLPAIQQALDKATPQEMLMPPIVSDMVLDCQQLTWQLYQDLQGLAPFGVDNEEPLIAIKDPKITNAITMGSDNSSLRLNLANPQVTVVGFKTWGKFYDKFVNNNQHCKYLLGHLDRNFFRNQQRLQFILEDAVFDDD